MTSRLRLLAASSHPGPTVVVTVLVIVLSAALGHSPGRTAGIAAVVLVGQLSIGLANDWLDADRDRAVGRSDKPVARGLIPVETVRTAALVCAAVTVVASFAFGPAAGIAHVVLVGSGWAYDVVLKRTVVSVLPFVVSFGLLPAVATLAGPVPALPATWALVTGAVFGVAIHFTNVLPDLADDRETGIVGLPHRLGRRPTGVVAFAALAVAAGAVLLGQTSGQEGVHGGGAVLAVTGAVVTWLLAAVGTWTVLTRPPTRVLFRLVMVASLVLVVQLAFSGSRLIG
ncbi:UbiA family prenyltransferase [Curtobacterium sp. Leaf261]|uniref:UbiA family prenyltransferase n=1 Tax=Curtobacterium sp. Leaf261 TaxID=1736311 RepID=UPI0006F5496D|nr:UbiA family prenyltransferase [Curtobacterium sp. Leaf261]KQO64865.1 1,4-dihydroxy-2-naphthoate prenyltransferase [Curtobacterium sp. Leaf261]